MENKISQVGKNVGSVLLKWKTPSIREIELEKTNAASGYGTDAFGYSSYVG
ncbi:MAG: hypothetical protein WA705_30035 [Candidatus Ozemobacteraceae bacterium]